MTDTREQMLDLREYVRVLRERSRLIALVAVTVVAAVLVWSLIRTPLFQAEAKILVLPLQNPLLAATSTPPEPDVLTEAEVVASEEVAVLVSDRVVDPPPTDVLLENVEIEVVPDTTVLAVRYEDPDPGRAAEISNAFADAYLDFRRQLALEEVGAAAEAIRRDAESVREELAEIAEDLPTAPTTAEADSLRGRRIGLRAELEALETRLVELENVDTVARGGQVVAPAQPPTSPSSPNLPRALPLALFAGLVLGALGAFTREALDQRLKTSEDVEREVGAPVIGAVPRYERQPGADRVPIVLTDPRNPISEAYRTLATNVEFAALRQRFQLFMVTSSRGGEGKSTTAANLAVVLAQGGKRVIVLSADLRLPRVHQYFNIQDDLGLSDVLGGSIYPPGVIKDTSIPSLRIVTAGEEPSNPAALLTGPRIQGFLESLRASADFVIVDTPAVLPVADASILAPLVDGTLFVVSADETPRHAVRQSREQLETAGASIVGTVFTFDPRSGSNYARYYGEYQRYYGREERKPRRLATLVSRRAARTPEGVQPTPEPPPPPLRRSPPAPPVPVHPSPGGTSGEGRRVESAERPPAEPEPERGSESGDGGGLRDAYRRALGRSSGK